MFQNKPPFEGYKIAKMAKQSAILHNKKHYNNVGANRRKRMTTKEKRMKKKRNRKTTPPLRSTKQRYTIPPCSISISTYTDTHITIELYHTYKYCTVYIFLEIWVLISNG